MKSSSDPVVVATGLRVRGARGHLTATLVPAGIDQLQGRKWLLVSLAGRPPERFDIESASSYGRKAVVKLRGVDSADRAASLAGGDILLPCNGLVDLPDGAYYIFELLGLRVLTLDGREIGMVRGVVETGGTPLLAVVPSGTAAGRGEEVLLPATRAICREIDPASGRITIDPPDGLLELYGL